MNNDGAALTSLYNKHLLNDAIIGPIVEKERMRDYPLDRLNDMRSIINYSVFFSERCCYLSEFYVDLAKSRERISTSRLFRIVSALLLGLAVSKRLQYRLHAGLEPLIHLLTGELIFRLKQFPESDDLSDLSTFRRFYFDRSGGAKLAGQVSSKATELADRLGMGEHNLYSHAPVLLMREGRVVARSFFYPRRSPAFPHRLAIRIGLRDTASYEHVVPAFRGRPMRAIDAEDRAFVDVAVDGRAVLDVTELASLDRAISEALRRTFTREEHLRTKINLDVRKMIIYSAEQRDFARQNGTFWTLSPDEFSAIADDRVCRAFGLNEGDGYAREMFQLISVGVTHMNQWYLR